jgi:hypothetical protein
MTKLTGSASSPVMINGFKVVRWFLFLFILMLRELVVMLNTRKDVFLPDSTVQNYQY